MNQKCECERCGTCHGIGRIFHECYDEPQDERCDDCDGSGYTFECEACQWEAEQQEEDALEWERQQDIRYGRLPR